MTREEGLRLTNQFNQLSLPSSRISKLDYAKFGLMDNQEFKRDVLHNEKLFMAIYQDISINILDYINSEEHTPEEYNKIKNFFTPASIFDSIVTILVREMRRMPFR